jgi:thioesterase domain-containing protein
MTMSTNRLADKLPLPPSTRCRSIAVCVTPATDNSLENRNHVESNVSKSHFRTLVPVTRTARPIPQSPADVAAPPAASPTIEPPVRESGAQLVAFWNEVLGRATSVIVPLNEKGNGPAFYCVHSLGGEAACFRHLAQLLGPEQRFYGIQVPTRKRTAEFASSVEAIAQYYTDALVAFQPDGPFIIGGWSAGSIIGLEMARQLRARGREVLLFVALDGAPYNTGAGISLWNPVYYCKLAGNLPRWIRDDLMKNSSAKLLFKRVLSKAKAIAKIAVSAVRGDSITRGHAVEGFMDTSSYSHTRMAYMKALFNALRRYVPPEYPERVVVYAAKTQPLCHLLQVDAIWTKIAANAAIVPVKGTHLSIIDRPHVDALAADLRKRLAEFSAV